jgi:hypothetical protein
VLLHGKLAMKSTRFDKTKAALAIFDAGQKEREALWLAIVDNKTFKAAVAADTQAMELVRVAFFEDTQDVNSWGHAKIAGLDFIRMCAAREDSSEKTPSA